MDKDTLRRLVRRRIAGGVNPLGLSEQLTFTKANPDGGTIPWARAFPDSPNAWTQSFGSQAGGSWSWYGGTRPGSMPVGQTSELITGLSAIPEEAFPIIDAGKATVTYSWRQDRFGTNDDPGRMILRWQDAPSAGNYLSEINDEAALTAITAVTRTVTNAIVPRGARRCVACLQAQYLSGSGVSVYIKNPVVTLNY